MKRVCGLLIVLAACMLAACESAPVSRAGDAGNGTALGNSGVQVSGSVETGGSVTAR